jgi:hypothetical protein
VEQEEKAKNRISLKAGSEKSVEIESFKVDDLLERFISLHGTMM